MKLSRILALVLALFMLCACGAPATPTTTPTEGEDSMLPKDKEYSILFIGNSYTFFNDMPTVYFQTMAKACGYQVKVTSITKGAYTLEKFANPEDPYGKLVANALAGYEKYDFVILQEQSVRPATAPEKFYDGVRPLVEKIRAIGAQPVLYATWGRQEGCDKLTEIEMTNESMTWKLAAAYSAIAGELDIPVYHAGLAFYRINKDTQVDLYNADKSHPSAPGSYLAAMTLLTGIFGVDPVTAPFGGPVSGEEDAAVRQAVKDIVDNPPEIPEEYRLSSEGVTAAS